MGKSSIAIIGTNGLPAKYGGFETLTHYLVEYLANDFDVTVYCSKTPKSKRLVEFNGAKLVYIPLRANGWQSIVYDFLTIFHAFFHSDNLIILGFSGAFAFPFNKLFRKNIVFNIGGIEWKKVRGSKLSASLEIRIKKWMERMSVVNSQSVIIDNATFHEYLVKQYGIEPVLAEYGGDHAVSGKITESLIMKYPFLVKSYDLSVSRAQEDMNIHIVIEGYKSLPHRTLVIISNWHISDYGRNLYQENYNKYANIILLNAIYEADILNAIRGNCEVYLHTHSLCGTAPSLVEAMSLNKPIVSFDVPTNRSTTEEKAIYFADANALINVMKNLTVQDMDKTRKDMLEIAGRRYKWARISEIYRQRLT